MKEITEVPEIRQLLLVWLFLCRETARIISRTFRGLEPIVAALEEKYFLEDKNED